jgi:tRNA(Leu) C34 or U34 (ribose-2'-O)-methylase TrmL
MDSAVLLHNPKHGENVGGAIRACAAFAVPVLRWTGGRVLNSKRVARYGRLVQDENGSVDYGQDTQAFDALVAAGLTPIAVELGGDTTSLPTFVHPERAFYVFGPEDSSLSKELCERCEAHVEIPTRRCLNLAAAVNVVLYDRTAKLAAQRAYA